MPDTPLPDDPNLSDPPGSNEPEPSDPSPPSLPSEPTRYSEDDAPYPWAVGRTSREVADIAQQLMSTIQHGVMPPAPAQPTQPHNPIDSNAGWGAAQPQAPNYQQPPVGMPDPELALRDADQYNRQMSAYMDQRDQRLMGEIQKMAAPMAQTTGMLARQQLAADPEYNDIFTKYGHEIDMEMQNNNIPPQARTPQAYKIMADMIRGRHYKELARAEAELLLQNRGPGTVRVGSDPGSGFNDGGAGDTLDRAWASDKIPYFRSSKAGGLTKADVREAAKRQGYTVDEFVTLVSGDDFVVAPDGSNIKKAH